MKETLNSIRNRPRFKLKTDLTPEEFTSQLRKERERGNEQFNGIISSQETYIEVKTDDNPVWKPRLTLRAETDPVDGTVIRGIFGPKPSIWTLFMFLYIAFGTMLLLFGSLYYSMYLVKEEDGFVLSWAGVAAVLSLVGLMIVYISVKIGQMKSREQINKLRNFAERIVLVHEKEEEQSEEEL